MGKLIYLMTTSLDGYVADEDGNFGWAMPTEEVHAFVNETLRNVGTVLMGRKLYETMKVFDPNTIQKLVAESDKDFDIGGPHLAAVAIKAGIVDEYHQIIVPELIGSGNYWLPRDVKSKLKLVDLRKFENGFVHLQYSKG
jgi:dihydrofolate reductase